MRNSTINKTYLGRLCKSGHEYFNTGKSLRYKSNAMCVTCHNQRECKKGIVQNDLIPIIDVLRKYPVKNHKHKLGRICRKSHKYKGYNYSLRYISNDRCVECHREHRLSHVGHYRDYRRMNKDKINKKNKEKILTPDNISHNKKIRRKYRRTHKKEITQYKINEYHRKKKDPTWLLDLYMATGINQSLKGKKMGRHWGNIVGYTAEELRVHIESQFTKTMNWENYGTKWHLDHKLPKRFFKFSCAEDIGFKKYWSLKNLRPLMKRWNLTKGAKILKKYEKLFRAGV